MTALATKTVIYVTHQVEFLPAADLILVPNFLFTLLLILCYCFQVSTVDSYLTLKYLESLVGVYVSNS